MSTPPREPDDRDLHEMMSRLEQEFHARPQSPEQRYTPPPGDTPAPTPIVEEAYGAPRRIRLELPLSPPRAIFVLLAINVIMYGISVFVGGRIGWNNALYVLGGKENQAIDAGQWWRLLTPMVLHGNLTHLLFNSWALYALGTEAERVYGTLRFLAIYLLSGLAGSIASYVFNPDVLSVGASGAIFGLLGALAAFAFTARSFVGWEASKMQLGQMATLAVINLAFGFVVPNIDNSAHIGGLIIGGISGLALAPRYVIERRTYMPTVERRDVPLIGWIVAAVLLVGLVGWFLVAQP
ncbi:MAG: rhomboid family intramembrane serine protease [Chloroflexi bacterium]|nr:rhomboid family intramembrane serine protease [Chloroflexota bacterium]